jgi:hypothetical protein
MIPDWTSPKIRSEKHGHLAEEIRPIKTLAFRAHLEGLYQGCHANHFPFTKLLEGLSESFCLPIDLVNYVMHLEDLETILKIQLMFECTL